jgi:phage tail tape-measure protein
LNLIAVSSQDTFDELTASPSQSFIQMFEYLYKLANDINNTISHQAVKEIIEDILEQIATGLLDGSILFFFEDKCSHFLFK